MIHVSCRLTAKHRDQLRDPTIFLPTTEKWSSSDRPDGVVGTAGDDQFVAILQAGDAALVPVECPDELARRRAPDLDGPVARRRHDVPRVKVDDVDRCTVSDQHAPQSDVSRRVHVPDSNRPVLRLTDPKQMLQSRELIFRCTTLKFAQCRNGRPDRQTGLNIPPLCHNLGCTMFTLLSIFRFSCNY